MASFEKIMKKWTHNSVPQVQKNNVESENEMVKLRYLMCGLIKNSIIIIFAIIIVYLVYLSCFSTAVITAVERTMLIGDNFIKNLFCLIVFLVSGYLFFNRFLLIDKEIKRINEDKKLSDKYRRLLLGIIGLAAICFLLLVQKVPKSDQAAVCGVANNWINQNYSDLEKSGYIGLYPNQLGMAILLYYMAYLVGGNNYIVFQIINVLALVALYKGFADLSDCAGNDNFTGLAIIFMCGIFLPGILYTTFVYGTIIGLSCSVNALKYTINYSKDHKVRSLITGVALMFMAVVVKSNYMIFLLGLIIILLYMFIQSSDHRLLLPMLMMVFILLFSNTLIKRVTKQITGISVGKGITTLSWVEMGLQKNDELYDGWWNHYNSDSYSEAEFNTDQQKERVVRDFKQSIREFKENPDFAIDFFAGKNASQWNNPDFQGMWINQTMSSNLQYPSFIDGLFSEHVVGRCFPIMNYLQFILYFGVLLFVLFGEKNYENLYYEVVIIGGFIFHTFWEAKCQYTFPFAMLMVPLSVQGYIKLLTTVPGSDSAKKTFKKYILFGLIFLMFAAIIRFGNIDILNKVIVRNEDTNAYYELIYGGSK